MTRIFWIYDSGKISPGVFLFKLYQMEYFYLWRIYIFMANEILGKKKRVDGGIFLRNQKVFDHLNLF